MKVIRAELLPAKFPLIGLGLWVYGHINLKSSEFYQYNCPMQFI